MIKTFTLLLKINVTETFVYYVISWLNRPTKIANSQFWLGFQVKINIVRIVRESHNQTMDSIISFDKNVARVWVLFGTVILKKLTYCMSLHLSRCVFLVIFAKRYFCMCTLCMYIPSVRFAYKFWLIDQSGLCIIIDRIAYHNLSKCSS